MTIRTAAFAAALAVAAGLAFAGPAFALAEEDKAEAADEAAGDVKASAEADAKFKELEAMQPPALDVSKRGDREYVQNFMKERAEWAKKRGEAAGEFVEKYPDHPRRADALYMKAESLAGTGGGEEGEFAETVEAFIEAAPKDERGAALLYHMSNMEPDEAKQAEILRKVVAKYPDTGPGKAAKGALRMADAVGKPFELEFTDAISDKKISMADLKGKVVVVDFWATWCGPCVAEMPHMKELYAKYKDQGVEFIGVSLDQPGAGLEKLKQFVEKNEIAWPQYYQGNGWESEFSRSWGINSIPRIFVVDKDGNLHSANARGKLDEMIPELLKKAGEDKSASAG